MNNVVWVLEVDFHIYTINGVHKEVKNKRYYYDKIEHLLKDYREFKNRLVYGRLHAYDNFHIYRCVMEEQNLELVNNLLDMGE